MAQYIPILPRTGLWLFPTDGDGERFARIFAQTWRRLPLRARRRILKYWRDRYRGLSRPSRPSFTSPWWPSIELVPELVGRGYQGKGYRTVGCARKADGRLMFDSRQIGASTDATVESVIGHELAHVYLFTAPPEWPDIDTSDEFPVDEVMELWGLDPEPASWWFTWVLARHGRRTKKGAK